MTLYEQESQPLFYRTEQSLPIVHTVGLVVEYSPATGETRVRFPDGVAVSFFDILARGLLEFLLHVFAVNTLRSAFL